jgi:hypothetical protein
MRMGVTNFMVVIAGDAVQRLLAMVIDRDC